jgi:hypothetical protein
MSARGALYRSESERLLKLVLSVHKGLIGKEWKKRRRKLQRRDIDTKRTSEERPHTFLCSSSSIAFALSGSDFTLPNKGRRPEPQKVDERCRLLP